jgi:hypothetical protein
MSSHHHHNHHKRRKIDDDYLNEEQSFDEYDDDEEDEDLEEENENEANKENIDPNALVPIGDGVAVGEDEDDYDASKDNWLYYCRFKKDGCSHQGYRKNGKPIIKHERTCPLRKNRPLLRLQRRKEPPTLKDLTNHSRYGDTQRYVSSKKSSRRHRKHRHHRHHHNTRHRGSSTEDGIVGTELVCYSPTRSSRQKKLLLPPSSSLSSSQNNNNNRPIDPREFDYSISYVPTNAHETHQPFYGTLPTLTYNTTNNNTESPDFLNNGSVPVPSASPTLTPPVLVRGFVHITLPNSPFQKTQEEITNSSTSSSSSFNDTKIREEIRWNQNIISENCEQMQKVTTSCSILLEQLTTTLTKGEFPPSQSAAFLKL